MICGVSAILRDKLGSQVCGVVRRDLFLVSTTAVDERDALRSDETHRRNNTQPSARDSMYFCRGKRLAKPNRVQPEGIPFRQHDVLSKITQHRGFGSRRRSQFKLYDDVLWLDHASFAIRE